MNDLALTANNKRKFVVKLDAEKLAAENRYALSIAECDVAVKAKSDALRAWAEANPEAFGKKKSIEFAAGTLGFRTGTEKVSLLSRAWNWEKVLDAIKNRAFQFVRTKDEVDKDSILSFVRASTTAEDREAVTHDVLKPIGVKIEQEESFFVEPKLTEMEVV
jgi:phage host-nuclease inhibitor protein Gam